MKATVILSSVIVGIIFALPATADVIYVRIPGSDNSISDKQKEIVRETIKGVVKEHGDTVAANYTDTKIALLAIVKKERKGFLVQVQKIVSKKKVASQAANSENLADAAKQAASNLLGVEAVSGDVALTLPEKGSAPIPQPVVHEPQTRTEVRTTPHTSVAPVTTVLPEANNHVKTWFVGLGPVISNNLVGSNGTKYAVSLGINQGISEYWDFLYFYDGNFNSGSQGTSQMTSIGFGAKFYLADRLENTAPYFRADLSYGGSNKTFDSYLIAGGAFGVDLFRVSEFTFSILVREFALITSGNSSYSSWPSATQILLGLNF